MSVGVADPSRASAWVIFIFLLGNGRMLRFV